MKASLFGAACIALLVAVFAREAILAPPPARAATLADAERAEIYAAVAMRLATPGRTLTFVDDGFRVPRDPVGGRIAGGGVLLTLHAIVMPEAGTLAADGTAYIANEAGAGNRYLFRHVDGHWVLARTVPGRLS